MKRKTIISIIIILALCASFQAPALAANIIWDNAITVGGTNTIELTSESYGFSGSRTLTVEPGADITIVNEGLLEIPRGYAIIDIGVNATVRWRAEASTGSYGDHNVLRLKGSGTFIMESGLIESSDWMDAAIYAEGGSNVDIIVDGGTVIHHRSENGAIYNAGNGTITVNGGTVTGAIIGIDTSVFHSPQTVTIELPGSDGAIFTFTDVYPTYWYLELDASEYEREDEDGNIETVHQPASYSYSFYFVEGGTVLSEKQLSFTYIYPFNETIHPEINNDGSFTVQYDERGGYTIVSQTESTGQNDSNDSRVTNLRFNVLISPNLDRMDQYDGERRDISELVINGLDSQPVSPLDGADDWAVPELELAIENGLVLDDMFGNWAQPTSRLMAADVIVRLIETITGSTIGEIAAENGYDMSDSFTDTDSESVTFLKASEISNEWTECGMTQTARSRVRRW